VHESFAVPARIFLPSFLSFFLHLRIPFYWVATQKNPTVGLQVLAFLFLCIFGWISGWYEALFSFFSSLFNNQAGHRTINQAGFFFFREMGGTLFSSAWVA